MRTGVLVDHPCLPVLGAPAELREAGVPVDVRRLSRIDRVRIAAQLASFAAVLAEFELWPGRRTLERAVVRRIDDVVRVEVEAPPIPILPVLSRMGGGEAAADRLRSAVVGALEIATGVPRSSLEEGMACEGFFLEPLARFLVARLPRPLDVATARSLWAVRWSPPPVPEPGELAYWSVEHLEVAARLAVALHGVVCARGERAWIRWPRGDDVATVPMPPVGVEGTLIVVGEIGPGDLTSVGQWVRGGARAVVLGRLPAGWNAPRPHCFASSTIEEQLALAGLPADRARLRVRELCGRFDPLDPEDRRALTLAASVSFEEVTASAPAESPVERLAALRPEGVPEGFVIVHAGVTGDELRRQATQADVSIREGTCRLVRGRRLRPDPLHAEVAELYPRSDPRRLRHRALAGGDVEPLSSWATERLEALEDPEVRRVLSPVEPGALGLRTQLQLAEACLSQLDLAGAREALAAVPSEEARPWQQWLDALDPPPGPVGPGSPDGPEAACRALAEVGVRVVRRGRRDGEESLWSTALPALVARLRGDARRRIEVDLVAATDPAKLADRAWRRQFRGAPSVWRRVVHRRALDLARRGQAGAARRLLEGLLREESSPGRRGLLEHDLGSVADSSREACVHTLRAVRLLQTAGFQHRTRGAIFNLAVCDLDELHVSRAAARLDDLAAARVDLHVEVERVRLALAVGDEAEFRRRIAALPEGLSRRDARFGEAVSLLQGVAALLDGRTAAARSLFERSGEEGLAWGLLARALAGAPVPTGGRVDGWGVVRAARLISSGSPTHGAAGGGESDPRDAFAHALAARLQGSVLIDGAVRTRMADLLDRHGCSGWAEVLREESRAGSGLVRAVTGWIEEGDLGTVGPASRRELLSELGLDGILVRRRSDRTELVRWGSGPEGEATTSGAMDVVPLGGAPRSDEAWRLLAAVVALLAPSTPGADPEATETGLIGGSDAIRALRADLRRLAGTALTVVLRGETGTGKEVAARALHRLSGRRGRFVPVNVAAIPATLLEAELFGAVRGAYTGAGQPRRGLVDAADGGTLLLDEIGDLEPPLQVKMLRFLESREVRPVGSDRPHPVDVRFVAATHRDLAAMVADGRFRSDLYYRINGVTVWIPPLRDRRDDIPALRDHFQDEAAARLGLPRCRWSAEAEELLASSPWPGNARELRHVVEVAMVRAAGGVVAPCDLPLELPHVVPRGRWEDELDRFRRELVESALDRAGGNRSAAARQLGISRQSLLYHIKRLGVR